MDPKTKFWLFKAKFGTYLWLGAVFWWLLASNGEDAVGFAFMVAGVVAAAVVYARVDRPHARRLPSA